MNETKKFNSNIRIFKVLTLVSLILFFLIALLFTYILLMTFLHPNYRFFFIHLLLIFQSVSAWIGMVLVIISKKKIKHDYAQIPSSHKKYMIGIGLIIISFGMISIFIVFLTSNPTSSFAILVSIISIVSILGFLISWSILKKTKGIYENNPEQILESKKAMEIEKQVKLSVQPLTTDRPIERKKIYYCPQCKTRVEADLTACPSCNQDLKEIPPITWRQLTYKYCPRCQKNVETKSNFSPCCCVLIVFLLIQAVLATGITGTPIWFITPAVVIIFTFLQKPKCSKCGKKTQEQRADGFLPIQVSQVQAEKVSQKLCANCGNPVKPSSNNFCEYCGKELKN